MLIYIIILLLIILITGFLFRQLDNYYENKKIKRWSNVCRLERDMYRNKYEQSPPGWENE